MQPLTRAHRDAQLRLEVARRRVEALAGMPESDPQVAVALDAATRERQWAIALAAEWDLTIDRENENDPAAFGRPGS